MKTELERRLAVDSISTAGRDIEITADAGECRALASRMKLPAVLELRCHFHLLPGPDETWDATGRLEAGVVQTCVVTLDDFKASIDERFAIRFVPEGTESQDDDPDSIDELPYSQGYIDLGEAAAQQLALSLDPYPHAPGASFPASSEPEPDDEAAEQQRNPFRALLRPQ